MSSETLITLVHKRASLDHNGPLSYRPASNLAFLSKEWEGIVNDLVSKQLNTNNINHPFQSEYRAKHSVETAPVRLQNDVATAFT